VLLDEEMLRERRQGMGPPTEPARVKGCALIDSSTYASMLPEEQVEVNLLGFRLAFATCGNAPL